MSNEKPSVVMAVYCACDACWAAVERERQKHDAEKAEKKP